MKKESPSRIVTVLKNIFNVRKWSDFDRMKSFTLYLGDGFKRLFVPQKTTGSGESFKMAMAKYNLSEKDLVAQQKALFRLSILMFIAAILVFSYAVYHVIYGSISAVIISLVVMLIALTLAFRYHFWYYQIKVRKLGCTFREWFRQGLMGEKP
ncbi:type IV secretion protein IcmV [Legionella sp. MW5194]|uniref:type IVB secretion system protein IcmV n=1 Tax=Legionella sp. MW5194 TaxID=2662448 RepID=UPI00193CD7A0|nr:type IVB secretion system protein IcmV [Legionella sp. MW5194]QRN02861.1 type IV secretion protein IcmV [Legionella sp. MW5194]